MLESYMIFGGIPFYLNLFDKSLSFSQNVDRLCFGDAAPLKDEYRELYHSLFNKPQRHMRIVEALAGLSDGMTRNEIAATSGLAANGHLTEALSELEQCDFIERYADFTRPKNGAYYYLKDPFTLFYLRYMKNNNTKDEYFWTNYSEDGRHRAWSGYAFELVCKSHLRQLKQGLGISGVSTSTASWRSKETVPGAQIDLLINRRDGVVNLCEIKYAKHPYTIRKTEAEALERRRSVFAAETKTKNALHITMITTYGLEQKGYFSLVQSQITMDNLFL
jgi:AAA+ ATPase superfamily predicted ATPase